MKNYDITIIGAGIVGLSLANSLTESGLRIALIDPRDLNSLPPLQDYDLRVSAITPASTRIFKRLNVWHLIEQQRVTPYHAMRVFDAEADGEISFSSYLFGQAYLGHIVENSVIIRALFQRLQVFPNIDCYFNQQAETLEGKELQLKSGESLTSDLIVGADGANSWLRQQAGFELKERAYGHQAIVATVKTERPHANTAWQNFHHTGPVALLPLSDPHYSSLVWSSSEDLMPLSDEDFSRQLSREFPDDLGEINLASQRLAFPLRYRHAKTYIKPGIALVGDAAHTIHPLAGQGVNLGLLDAACLSEAVSKARDINDPRLLRRYNRHRQGHNRLMATSMDAFKYLFASHQPSLIMARNQGLNTINQLPMIKQHVINVAMGNLPNLPELAQ